MIENRGGAGGNLAARAVATAAPDGHTLLATTTALAVNDTASKNRGYDTADLRPVAIVAISPDVLAVHPSNPAKDLKEFVANARKTSFTYGSAGVGTAPHIGAEYLFREVAKVQSVHVPFTGGAPATTAALGNHVNALVLTLPTVTPHIVEGRLRGLGIASDKRVPAVKDVPTYREMGFDVLSGSWVGFFAPAKTPDAIVLKLNAEINEIMKAPEVQAKLAQIGFDPIVKNHPGDRGLLQKRNHQLGQDGPRCRRDHRLAALDGAGRTDYILARGRLRLSMIFSERRFPTSGSCSRRGCFLMPRR